MAKNAIREYSTTAASNTDIGGIGVQGSNAVSNFDNAFRTIMAQLADMNAGNSPINDTFTLCDPADATKRGRFDFGNVSTATTRVVTFPDANVTISAFAATVLDDANAAAARVTLGTVTKAGDTDLGTMRFGGASVFSTVTDAGAIELCATFPYIDLKNNSGDDYDVRLALDGVDNSFAIDAAGGQKINGNVTWHNGNATSGTGWNRLPNGLIFQKANPVISLNAFGTGIVTLPTSFASGSSYIPVVCNGDAAINYNFQIFVGGGYPSATQFAVQATLPSGAAAGAGNVRINYIAIGT